MKKHLLKTVLLAVGLLLGTTSTWADVDVIETVGAKDYSSGWWTAFSTGNYGVAEGQGRHITFVNHNNNGKNWNNWVVGLYDSNANTDAEIPSGTEYAVIRADNYGWGNNIMNYWCNFVWEGFVAAMNDATVDMYIYHKGTNVFIYNTITTSTAQTWQYNICLYNVEAATVYPRFTVDNAYIEITGNKIEGIPSTVPDYPTIGSKDPQVWTEATNARTINSGNSYHFRFKNYMIGTVNGWENFKIRGYQMTQNPETSEYNVVEEKFMMRADDWDDVIKATLKDNFAGVNFVSLYTGGALVDVVVTYNTNNSATVRADITSADGTAKYYEEETVNLVAGLPLYVVPAVNGAYLEILQEAATYNVAVSSANNEYGSAAITSGATEGVANAGAEVTVTATPAAGYQFVNWTENGVVVSTAAAYTYRALDNHTLVANFAPVGTVVGATDFTTPSLGAHSESITLSPNQKATYKFYNYSDKGKNFHNWIACVAGEEFATTSEAGLKVALRADNWENVQGANTGITSNYNWDTFLSEMDGSEVELSFTYQNDDVIIRADITAQSGNKYFEEFTKTDVSGKITVAVGVENSFLVITDQQKKVLAESKTMTDAGWATYCSDNALDLTGEIANLTDAYIITGGNNTTKYVYKESVKGQIVPANVGLLLEGTAGEIVFPVADADATTDAAGNALVGVTAEKTLPAEAGYVLLKESEVVAFYKNLNPFTLNANTAYLPANFAPSISEAPRFYALDGETTGIDNLNVDAEASKAEGTIYNLAGQRVSKDYKGLVIMNGKKVIIK